MDPPTAANTPQDGILNIRDFIDPRRGDARSRRVRRCRRSAGLAAGRQQRRRRILAHARASSPARRAASRSGRRRARADDRRHRRRLYRLRCATRSACAARSCRSSGSTTCSARSRSFGLFLGGGSNEGLVGITYEVVGPPSAPVLRVNPISAVAPGLLRKFFEFPTERRRERRADLRRAIAVSAYARRQTSHTGFSSTCRFLPSDSLITPSGVSCAASAPSSRRSR